MIDDLTDKIVAWATETARYAAALPSRERRDVYLAERHRELVAGALAEGTAEPDAVALADACVNAARQLGSSVAILASVFQLRDRLAPISFIFRENAADLYPRKVLRLQRETLVGRSKLPRGRLARLRTSLEREHGRRSPLGRIELDKLDLEDFPLRPADFDGPVRERFDEP